MEINAKKKNPKSLFWGGSRKGGSQIPRKF